MSLLRSCCEVGFYAGTAAITSACKPWPAAVYCATNSATHKLCRLILGQESTSFGVELLSRSIAIYVGIKATNYLCPGDDIAVLFIGGLYIAANLTIRCYAKQIQVQSNTHNQTSHLVVNFQAQPTPQTQPTLQNIQLINPELVSLATS